MDLQLKIVRIINVHRFESSVDADQLASPEFIDGFVTNGEILSGLNKFAKCVLNLFLNLSKPRDQGSYRHDCVKFKDFSRLSYCFQRLFKVLECFSSTFQGIFFKDF